MNNGRKLEQYRAFPVVAWVVFVGFALFVYTITLELRDVSDSLKFTTENFQGLENQIQANSERLDVLEAAQEAE